MKTPRSRNAAFAGRRLAFGLFGLTLVILALVFTSGCSQSKGYTMDPEFSVNVARPDPGWPEDLGELSPYKQDVIRKRGLPDFIHINWSRMEEVVDRTTMVDIVRSKMESVRGREASWLYLGDGEEVHFPTTGGIEVTPISDQLRVVCEMGDPQRREVLNTSQRTARRHEKWTYLNYGWVFEFMDGTLVERYSLPPLRHYETW